MSSSSRSSARILRRRERRAAEQLLDNSALRDELTDDQANILLEWSFDHLATAVGRTAKLPDEDAEMALEPMLTALSRVMLAVNRLAAHFSNAGDDSEIESAIAQLVNNLALVQELPDHIYDELALLVIQPNAEAVFTQLMKILTLPIEALETTPAADVTETDEDTSEPELPDTTA